MTTDQLREAARRRDEHNPRLLLEASGGITLHNIAAAARTGIDRVAVGAITHQAAAIDIALDAAPAD
jgi:nicotinate-nucleotide pyrophosphorylase (carboxylating)